MNVMQALAAKGFGSLDHRPSTDLHCLARINGDAVVSPDGKPGAWVVGLDLAGKLARSYVHQGAKRWNVAAGLPVVTLEATA